MWRSTDSEMTAYTESGWGIVKLNSVTWRSTAAERGNRLSVFVELRRIGLAPSPARVRSASAFVRICLFASRSVFVRPSVSASLWINRCAGAGCAEWPTAARRGKTRRRSRCYHRSCSNRTPPPPSPKGQMDGKIDEWIDEFGGVSGDDGSGWIRKQARWLSASDVDRAWCC